MTQGVSRRVWLPDLNLADGDGRDEEPCPHVAMGWPDSMPARWIDGGH